MLRKMPEIPPRIWIKILQYMRIKHRKVGKEPLSHHCRLYPSFVHYLMFYFSYLLTLLILFIKRVPFDERSVEIILLGHLLFI